MNVSFVVHAAPELEGSLVYAASDHSFRFDPGSPAALMERAGDAGLTSLAIGTLQIEVGVATHVVLFAWGLHPRANWVEGPLPQLPIRPGKVEVVYPPGLQRGVSVGLADVGEWLSIYDPATGWLRVAPAGMPHEEEAVLVSTGVALGIPRHGGELTSAWLQPVFD